MEERRTFVNWVKSPVEFGNKFEYVKFRTDGNIYKYDGFDRVYNHGIILNFRKVFLENNELALGYTQPFHPSWYNSATHFTEKEVTEILMKEKMQNAKPKEKETEGWFKKWIKF